MPGALWRLGPLLLILASALEAQPIEVPLTWSLRPAEGRVFFPLGCARLEKSLVAPEGWKLPPLVSTIPAFGKLRLGDRDFLFVLDRSDPKEPFYDRLFFDRTGDGDLTDDLPLDADAARGQRGGFNAERKVWFYHATFTSPLVEIPVDGRSQPYAFRATAYYSSGRGPAREDLPVHAVAVPAGLLAAKRRDRVHPQGAARRDVACQRGDGCHSTAADANATQSFGPIPYSRLRSHRETPNAPASPRTSPTKTGRMPNAIVCPRTCRGVAPSATRTPMSAVRRVTMYAWTP